MPATARHFGLQSRPDQPGNARHANKFDATADVVPLRRPGAKAGQERSFDLVHQAISHLEANFTEPVTLRDLESITAFNTYQIIRAFRRHLGTTPHAYLMRLRVRQARSLLNEGESIIGASAEAGFVDQSHFTKHFKRAYGTTPGEYVRSRIMSDRH